MFDLEPFQIKGLCFILSAYGVSTAIIYFGFKQVVYLKWFMMCSIVTAAAFLSTNAWVVDIIILVVVCLSYSKNKIDNLAVYLVLLPLLPISWGVVVPGFFPGMRFLIDLTHPLYLSLLILVPLLLFYYRGGKDAWSSPLRGRARALDALVLGYFLLTAFFEMRAPTITAGIRSVVELFLFLFLPYFILSRYLKTVDDFFCIFRAILYSVLISAIVAIVSEIMHWNIYSSLGQFMLHGVYAGGRADVRGAFLRVNYTMISPISFGYFLLMGLCALYGLFAWYRKQKLFLLFLSVLVIIPLVFTVSRGAWLATSVFVGMLYYLHRHWVVKFIIVVAMIVLFSLSGFLSLGGDDAYGTFSYREQLIKISMDVYSLHPLFGDRGYMSSYLFDPLRLGDGFIDIVNAYLGILLEYGIIMLMLFSVILLLSFILLAHSAGGEHGRSSDVERNKLFYLGRLLSAMMLATIVFLGTVSSFTYIPVYYWILIGMSVSYFNILEYSGATLPKNNNSI